MSKLETILRNITNGLMILLMIFSFYTIFDSLNKTGNIFSLMNGDVIISMSLMISLLVTLDVFIEKVISYYKELF